ncbi:MAG: ABC transporter ATP-binding protein [Anaerolineales bacterium]
MTKPFRERELVRILALLESKVWIYFAASLVSAGVLGFSFNLVLAFIQMDVMNAAVSGEFGLLRKALILAGVTFVTGVPLLIGARYVIALFEKLALTKTRVMTFRKIVDLEISHFDQQHSGDLISRCTNDLNTLGAIYSRLIPTLLFGLVLGLVGIISVFVLNWQMGILALVLGLLTTWVSTALSNPLRAKSTAIQESLSKLTQQLSDILQGLPVTKMFQLEETTQQLYSAANQGNAQAALDHAGVQAIYDALNALISWIRTVGTLAFGLFLLGNDQVGLGAIVAAIHLQSNASFMFTNLGDFVTNIQRSLAGSARVFELLSWPTETMEGKSLAAGGENALRSAAVIEMRELSFRYSDPDRSGDQQTDRNLLDHINISIAEGQFVALVGPSGGGKSTLVKILMGLYPVSEGTLRVNGKELADYPLEELRDLMAYVPQDAYLFDGTIEENIRYGRPGATMEEVTAAARSANAHDFIREQPEGYQTLVGERGARLSGGQRQRIAIARALLKDAPLLLLDEATSALDSESEAVVQKALETLMKGRTTIAIAHRLSTIQHADQIYVMQAGQVVEQGSHNLLLEGGGVYAELYTLQAAGGETVS